MKTRHHSILAFAIIGSLCVAVSSANAQTPGSVLVIPGDLKIPYQIIGPVAFVMQCPTEVALLGSNIQKSHNAALKQAFEVLDKHASENGANAVIQTQMQFIDVAIPSSGVDAELFVFGTMVKYATTQPDTLKPH